MLNQTAILLAYTALCDNGAEEWKHMRAEYPAAELAEAMRLMAFNMAQESDSDAEKLAAYNEYVAFADTVCPR